MSEGEDYDLHTHTEMYLEHVPGKCAGTCPLVRNNSEIKTTMHWSLLSGKKKVGRPRSSHWRHQTCTCNITGASSSSSSNNNQFNLYPSHPNYYSDCRLLYERLLPFFLIHYCKAIWILSLIASNINFAAGTCCTIMHTMIMASHPKFSCCDKSHEVQRVELRVKCCVSDKVPAYTRGCVAAACPCNTCANCAIWSLLHVPATEPCNMSP